MSNQHTRGARTPKQADDGERPEKGFGDGDDPGPGDNEGLVWLDVEGETYSDLRRRRNNSYLVGGYSLVIPPGSFDSQPDPGSGVGNGGVPGDG